MTQSHAHLSLLLLDPSDSSTVMKWFRGQESHKG